MSLRRAVAAPFRDRGADRLTESELVVALSLDRSWFSPDQAERSVALAVSEGLLKQTDDADDRLRPTFDAADVELPEEFEPDDAVLTRRSTFERLLDSIVEAGVEKQTAVAEINELQGELGVTIEAAGALYARRRGIEVGELAAQARGEL